MEEWRSIKSYEGIYEVSSWGRVRSVDRYIKHKTPQGEPCESFRSGVVLRAWSDKDGYKMVALRKTAR